MIGGYDDAGRQNLRSIDVQQSAVTTDQQQSEKELDAGALFVLQSKGMFTPVLISSSILPHIIYIYIAWYSWKVYADKFYIIQSEFSTTGVATNSSTKNSNQD